MKELQSTLFWRQTALIVLLGSLRSADWYFFHPTQPIAAKFASSILARTGLIWIRPLRGYFVGIRKRVNVSRHFGGPINNKDVASCWHPGKALKNSIPRVHLMILFLSGKKQWGLFSKGIEGESCYLWQESPDFLRKCPKFFVFVYSDWQVNQIDPSIKWNHDVLISEWTCNEANE